MGTICLLLSVCVNSIRRNCVQVREAARTARQTIAQATAAIRVCGDLTLSTQV